MTMVPMWKTCPKCHRKYDWNPDVGKFACPYCRGLGTPERIILDKIFGKKKEDDFPDEVEVNTENPILGKDCKPQNKRLFRGNGGSKSPLTPVFMLIKRSLNFG